MSDTTENRLDWAVKGLLEKRGELLQQVNTHYAAIAVLRNDVAAVNRVLATFGYDQELDETAPKLRNILFDKGQLARMLLDELRASPKPLKTFALATAVMKRKGLDHGDRKLFKEISHRTTNALRRMRVAGMVETEASHGGRLIWALSTRRDA